MTDFTTKMRFVQDIMRTYKNYLNKTKSRYYYLWTEAVQLTLKALDGLLEILSDDINVTSL